MSCCSSVVHVTTIITHMTSTASSARPAAHAAARERREHELLEGTPRVERMHDEPVRDFARDLDHARTEAPDEHRRRPVRDSDRDRTPVSSTCAGRTRPRNATRTCLPKHSQIARTADTSSRIRAAGCDHSSLKRFWMCGRICDPSPSTNRPPLICCRSYPTFASTIGFRAKPIATAVPRRSRDVVCDARASGRNGSCFASNENPVS